MCEVSNGESKRHVNGERAREMGYGLGACCLVVFVLLSQYVSLGRYVLVPLEVVEFQITAITIPCEMGVSETWNRHITHSLRDDGQIWGRKLWFRAHPSRYLLEIFESALY